MAVPLLLAGCVVPFVTPPLRTEIGGATQLTADRRVDRLHMAVGTHLASGTTRTPRFDLGLGWVFDLGDGAITQGGYFDSSMFVAARGSTRTSVGQRTELLWTAGRVGAAAKLRLDHELFGLADGEFSSSQRCGIAAGRAHGTPAIGLYVEAGHAWLPESPNAFVATAGITLRAPATYGVAIGIPFCR
ncbi:MAG: hypothetical protein ACTHU0_06580 [Kofleriaceae bacterium]